MPAHGKRQVSRINEHSKSSHTSYVSPRTRTPDPDTHKFLTSMPTRLSVRDGTCPPNSLGCNANDPPPAADYNPQATGAGPLQPTPSPTNPLDFTVREYPRAQIILGIVGIGIVLLAVFGVTLAILMGWTNVGMWRMCRRRRGYKTRFETVGTPVGVVPMPSQSETGQGAETRQGEKVVDEEVEPVGDIPQESSEVRLVGGNDEEQMKPRSGR